VSDDDLDELSASMAESRHEYFEALLRCALLVERRSAEGDPEAVATADQLRAARFRFRYDNARAQMVIEDVAGPV
jgi:hypothetical protein